MSSYHPDLLLRQAFWKILVAAPCNSCSGLVGAGERISIRTGGFHGFQRLTVDAKDETVFLAVSGM